MVGFPDKSIYLYNQVIDFRKGIASLTNLIYTLFPEAVKIIEIENRNIWLYQNRLEDHKFTFPKAEKDIQLTAAQLSLILRTVEPLRRSKRSQ